MEIKCPKCEESIPEKNLNIKTKLGHCNQCNITFKLDILAQLNTDKTHKDNASVKGISINKKNSKTEITLHDKEFTFYWFFVLFGISPFFIIGFSGFQFEPIALIAYTVLISTFAYLSLIPSYKSYFGKHVFTLESDRVIYSRVMPYPFSNGASKRVKIQDINQWFVKIIRRQVSDGDSGTKTVINYDLMYADPEGTSHSVITNFPKSDPLFYIERYIEYHYGIKDEHHPEEFNPNTDIVPKNFKETAMLFKEIWKNRKI